MTESLACPVALASLALVVHGLAEQARADVREVAPGESIQAMIDDPGTMDGDEIVLAPGTYVETISLNGRAVTIRSMDPSDPDVVAATVLDGGGGGTVVTCSMGEGPDTVIAGLTVTGGVGMSGGGFLCEWGSPTVVNCVIEGNHAFFDGGGAFCLDSDARFVSCRFLGNTAQFGGGVASLMASPTFVNCVFAGNFADNSGGALDVFNGGAPRVVNGTMSGNEAMSGGAISNAGGMPEVANSILWDNMAASGPEVMDFAAAISFSHSNVRGSRDGMGAWDGSMGIDAGGNLDADPMFDDEDLRLAAGSPCADAGSNDELGPDFADLDGDGDTAEPLPLDLDGNPRRADRSDAVDVGSGSAPLVDIGAYELEADEDANACPYDLDGDGRVGPRDLVMLLKCFHGGGRGHRCDTAYDVHDLVALLNAWGPCEPVEAMPKHRRGHPFGKRGCRR